MVQCWQLAWREELLALSSKTTQRCHVQVRGRQSLSLPLQLRPWPQLAGALVTRWTMTALHQAAWGCVQWGVAAPAAQAARGPLLACHYAIEQQATEHPTIY